MLDEDLYWQIVEESLPHVETQEEQRQMLIKRIEQLAPEEIVGFRLRTDQLLYDTYTSEMACADKILNGYCSDDNFEYFRNWVISRGKSVYYAAKENPDTLVSQVVEVWDFYEFELFWYVALDAFSNKTGQDLYDYIDEGNFHYTESKYPSIELNWDEDDPDSMKAICPQLYERIQP